MWGRGNAGRPLGQAPAGVQTEVQATQAKAAFSANGITVYTLGCSTSRATEHVTPTRTRGRHALAGTHRPLASAGGELRMTDLASKAFSSRSAISRRVDRMVEEGLVGRKSSDSDGRGVVVRMTEAGMARLVEAVPYG
jgi:hypothetical protein